MEDSRNFKINYDGELPARYEVQDCGQIGAKIKMW